jgi:hypothetical protein
MTRTRRRVRRQRPSGLAEIRKLELNRWAVHGPLVRSPDLDDDAVRDLERSGYVVWESYAEWAAFYGVIRENWRNPQSNYPDRRPEAAERLYLAIVAGQDPVEVRRQIALEQDAADPRDVLRS